MIQAVVDKEFPLAKCPEAVAYLKNKGHRLRSKPAEFDPAYYADFHTAWCAEYDNEAARDYEAAAAKHLLGGAATARVERDLGAKWFAMRGLDVKMMAVGGPLR